MYFIKIVFFILIALPLISFAQNASDIEREQYLAQFKAKTNEATEEAQEAPPAVEQKVVTLQQPNASTSEILESFRNVPEEKLKEHLQQITKTSKIGNIVLGGSKRLEFFTKLLRDPVAIPSIINIIKEKNKLIIYGICYLLTIALGTFLKRIDKQKLNKGILIGLWRYLVRFTFVNGLRLMLFVFFFYKEFTPAFRILLKSIF